MSTCPLCHRRWLPVELLDESGVLCGRCWLRVERAIWYGIAALSVVAVAALWMRSQG